MAYPQNGGHLEFFGDSIKKAKILILMKYNFYI